MSYAPQAPMMVQSGGNRNAKNLPVTAEGREWSNGLCSCCDEPGTCFVACCCPCITYGKVKQRYDHLQSHGTAHPDPGCVSGDCFLHCVTAYCGVAFIFQMLNRGSIRGRYNIKGGGCGDLCTACCCTPCELVQESRELELEEQSLGHQKH
ncbi:PLAC8-domain-containing protein [Coprinellus micaceus]|uniref:PLAC8-domain-containing protein n=1 Tax=Coprinellus micaceus TaxID=71717 RepID=A0A4Y7TAT2_COPMI|nr:PLAC8-domain-containing protein [Coprinellus micaceus]